MFVDDKKSLRELQIQMYGLMMMSWTFFSSLVKTKTEKKHNYRLHRRCGWRWFDEEMRVRVASTSVEKNEIKFPPLFAIFFFHVLIRKLRRLSEIGMLDVIVEQKLHANMWYATEQRTHRSRCSSCFCRTTVECRATQLETRMVNQWSCMLEKIQRKKKYEKLSFLLEHRKKSWRWNVSRWMSMKLKNKMKIFENCIRRGKRCRVTFNFDTRYLIHRTRWCSFLGEGILYFNAWLIIEIVSIESRFDCSQHRRRSLSLDLVN